MHVRLLPVLGPEHQDRILREELERVGWSRNADGSVSKTIGRATATLAAGSDVVVVEIASDTTASATATVEARASSEEVLRRATAEAADRLARDVADKTRALVAENIRDLEQALAVVQRDVTAATNATTKRALEQRATSLGTIEQSIEGKDEAGGYELTIVVKT